jgi:hypothetical protein
VKEITFVADSDRMRQFPTNVETTDLWLMLDTETVDSLYTLLSNMSVNDKMRFGVSRVQALVLSRLRTNLY